MTACANGRTSCVRLLLQDQRVMVNEPSNYGATPLWWAAYKGHQDVIKLWIGNNQWYVNSSIFLISLCCFFFSFFFWDLTFGGDLNFFFPFFFFSIFRFPGEHSTKAHQGAVWRLPWWKVNQEGLSCLPWWQARHNDDRWTFLCSFFEMFKSPRSSQRELKK